MANTPQDAKAHSMARDVDRLLSQLSRFGRQESNSRNVARAVGSAVPRPSNPPSPPHPKLELYDGAAAATSAVPGVESDTSARVGLWARVVLGAALGVFMNQWPYAHACGWNLLGYGGAIATVIVTASSIAFDSWRLRSGAAHIFSLVLFYWGLVLAAEQVLPRLGYAGDRPSWHCPARLFVSD